MAKAKAKQRPRQSARRTPSKPAKLSASAPKPALAATGKSASTSSKKRAASESYQQPSVRTYRTWTPAQLRQTEIQADGGSLSGLADLVDRLLADERIRKSYETVVGGLLSLDLSFEEGEGRRRKRAIKDLEVNEDWWAAFPEAELKRFLTAGLCAGVSFAQLVWGWRKDRLVPLLQPWSLHHFRYDTQQRKWFARVDDGLTEVDVNPGDGRWMMYAPFGSDRPWAYGQWRGLSPWWLLKRYAISDYGRSGAVGASLVATPNPDTVDPETIKDQRRQLSDHIYELSQQGGVIVLPNGFTLDVVELSANVSRIYEKQIAVANTSIDIAVQGQNLTSNVEGGSFAAASVHSQVQDRVIANVATTGSTTLHDQALMPWAGYNFGDPNLAPWPVWDTDPPEDAKAAAEAEQAEAGAVKAWRDAGYDVENVEERAAERGYKLVKRAEAEPPKQPVPPQNNNGGDNSAGGDNAPNNAQPPNNSNARNQRSGARPSMSAEPTTTTEPAPARLPLGPNGETISRLVICGGPRTGKSTIARSLREAGVPTYCGDPRSKVKQPEDGVTYLPEGIPISGDDGAAQWVLDNWMSKPGPWVLEGWVMARVLRRWLDSGSSASPFDAVLWLDMPRVDVSKGQAAMIKAVATVWSEVEPKLRERGVSILRAPVVLGSFATADTAEQGEDDDSSE